MKTEHMYINGKWVLSSSKKCFKLYNPSNQINFAQITQSTKDEILFAIKCAHDSFYKDSIWRNTDSFLRSKMLKKIANKLRENADEIAKIESQNTGKVIQESKSDVLTSAEIFDYFAGILSSITGNTFQFNSKIYSFSFREPLGVCAIIVPWNYPLSIACSSIAPALAMGNSIIVKPASIAPMSIIKLFEILDECQFPKGVVQLIHADGNKCGKILAESDLIEKIIFTGSTSVGKTLMKNSSSTLKKLSLELGGKSCMIIRADADLDSAIESIKIGSFSAQGQLCIAASRILVHKSIFEKFCFKIKNEISKLKIGDPLDPLSYIGPLISKSHHEKVLKFLENSLNLGATNLLSNLKLDKNFELGNYMNPAILINVNKEDPILKEEVFGPVITLESFSDDEEALNMANNSIYGLVSAIFTKELSIALEMSKSLNVGLVWINTYLNSYFDMSIEPQKQSGFGLCFGVEGLKSFTKHKSILYQI